MLHFHKLEVVIILKEQYKDIIGYEGIYQISNLGNVISLKFGKRKLLKQGKNTTGYYQVALCNNCKTKSFLVNRLVALHFIPNPENLPQINHKDENPLNNSANNLEWCNSSYNINYGNRNKNMAKSNSIPIIQYDINMNKICEFESSSDANRILNIPQSSISACCRYKMEKAGGFVWRYKHEHMDSFL